MKWIVPLMLVFLGFLFAGPIGAILLIMIWGIFQFTTTRKTSRK